MPPVDGLIARVAGSTPMIELIVLIRLTASAPPFLAASAGGLMSVTLGVSFTITGSLLCALHHAVTISMYSGTWPTAAPMPPGAGGLGGLGRGAAGVASPGGGGADAPG